MSTAKRILSVLLISVAAGQAQDWGSIHNLLIRFYGYQRAGAKVGDTHNPFYKTAPYPHAADGHQGKDLSGGWYDAGDFVKFGLPFGYAAYCLLKGYDVFPRAYDDLDSWDYKGAKDGIPDILGEVKTATDFMQKAVISSDVVVTDVGDAARDHGQLSESGYANSTRTSPRSAFVQTGADVAGLYAAAMALMSKLYKPHDSAYAAACLSKAREAFAFGLKNQKLSTQQGDASYYKTKTFTDKMACGAVELYRATGEADYLTHARSFQSKTPSHFFVMGYANTGDLSAFELTRLGIDGFQTNWITDVNLTISRVVTATTAPELIRGAFIRSDWGNAGHAGAAAFSAALAFQLTGDNTYRDFAVSQLKWVAGIAPFRQSYIVGVGNGPTSPHHRNDVALGGTGVRLKGGIVSGPTPQGTFNEGNPGATAWTFNGGDANNYKNTEVALDYNAGATGAVAFIRDYLNPPAGMVRILQGVKATPEIVDLNTQTVQITFTLETAAPWKLVLEGRTSKAKKTFSGSGTAGSATWNGAADEGVYMAGETVEARLENENIATYHLSRTRGSFFLAALKKEPFRADDAVIDDFEDGDAANALGGAWTVFNDKEAGGASYANPAVFGPSMSAVGESGTKGISVRLVGASGATQPRVGIRTVFNAVGTAVGLGPVKSMVFDVRSTAGSSLWVELEQASVSDGAYHAYQVPIGTDQWTRVRVPVAAFVQPAWRKVAVPLNVGSVTALRFAYNGVGTIRFDLDNVRIEGLKIGPAAVRQAEDRVSGLPVKSLRFNSTGIEYAFAPPSGRPGIWVAEIVDVSGTVLASRKLAYLGGILQVSFPEISFSKGWYALKHRSSQGAITQGFLIH